MGVKETRCSITQMRSLSYLCEPLIKKKTGYTIFLPNRRRGTPPPESRDGELWQESGRFLPYNARSSKGSWTWKRDGTGQELYLKGRGRKSWRKKQRGSLLQDLKGLNRSRMRGPDRGEPFLYRNRERRKKKSNYGPIRKTND